MSASNQHIQRILLADNNQPIAALELNSHII